MEINFNREYAIIGIDVRDINIKEMQQMHELKYRIEDVLNSHKEGSEKKKYISDYDLRMMRAILYVFTKGFASTQTSAFDDALRKLNAPVEEPEPSPITPGW